MFHCCCIDFELSPGRFAMIASDMTNNYSTNCPYAHIWVGSPQYLSSAHDTADFFTACLGGHFKKRGSFSSVLRKF